MWGRQWPTRDHAVPYKMFYLLLGAAANLDALNRLETVKAYALGEALAQNGKDPKVKTAMRNLTRAAFPEVR